MAECQLSPTPICRKNFRAIVIGGYKANEEEVKTAAWDIWKQIFDLTERKRNDRRDNLVTVINKAQTLSEVFAPNVTKVHDQLLCSTFCEEGITCAIFAHSHGVKILKKALKILSYHQPVNLDQIRNCLAIFTFGGIDVISRDQAKIVANIRLKSDLQSTYGTMIYGHKDNNSPILLFGKDDHPRVRHNFLPTSTEALHQMRAVSCGDSRHVLREYVNDQQVMEYVLDMLMISYGQKKFGCCPHSPQSLEKKVEYV